MPRSSAVIYWLYDERCVCPWRHGYVGMTVSWPHRLFRHRTESEFPTKHFQGQILFQGTIKQCLKLEQQLRPIAKIGWNKLPGGLAGHAAKGVPKSTEARANMRAAALARYQRSGEKERTSKAVLIGIKDRDQSGSNNGMFGKHMSEDAKQKVRDKITERGGINGKNNPNYGKRWSEDAKQAMREKLQKTVCKRGHDKPPGKPCRMCARLAERAYRERKRALIP